MRVFIYALKNPSAIPSKKFTHYGTNDGENFWDTVYQEYIGLTNEEGHKNGKRRTIEKEGNELFSEAGMQKYDSPISFYLSEDCSNFDKDYYGKELDATRFTRRTMDELRTQMDAEELNRYGTLFFKIVDGYYTNPDEPKESEGHTNDIPTYYYSEAPTEVSDQNYERVSYTIECALDKGATYGSRMHSIMKKCPEMVHFLQKMCDKFKYNLPNSDGEIYGFWIDYLDQLYLTRTNKYATKLIVSDERENFLTLEDGLYINSSFKKDGMDRDTFLNDIGFPWLNNQVVGTFGPEGDSGDTSYNPKITLENGYKAVNRRMRKLADDSLFLDSLYNANSKYRYLICKVGNNSGPNGSTPKQTMFANNLFFIAKSIVRDQATLQHVELNEQGQEVVVDGTYTGINTGLGLSGQQNKNVFTSELDIGFATNNDIIGEDLVVAMDNYIVSQKNLQITIDYNRGEYVTTKYGTDKLNDKSSHILINKLSENVDYLFKSLSTKSYIYDIEGDEIDISLDIGFKVKNEMIEILGEVLPKLYLTFKITFNTNVKVEVLPKIDISISKPFNFGSLQLIKSFTIDNEHEEIELPITGSEMLIIPFKKGEDENKFLMTLNTADIKIDPQSEDPDVAGNGITMGSGYVMGMPINDIPPSILAMASRKGNNENYSQTFGDAVSARSYNDDGYCPLSLVDLHTGHYTNISGQGHEDIDIPTIGTSFDYIPVTVATSPNRNEIYDVIGGNNFFNYFYDILTNDDITNNIYNPETGELISGGNTGKTHPIFYGPAFGKGCYYINGLHHIELTADMLDFKKMLTMAQGDINLNVNMTDSSHYFLDITDLKNVKYPMTKIGMELISGDSSSYPFTTEAYQNGLQQNQLTQETSKNAKDISQKWMMSNAMLGAGLGMIEAPLMGAANGAMREGAAGAAVGAGTGAAAGVANLIGKAIGTERKIKEQNEQGENKGRGMLGNEYSKPAQLMNPSGFSSGSIVYSPSAEAKQNSYELFKTYGIPDLVKQELGHDVSMNGEPFTSQCLYSDYNNRINYNIVNCNLVEKEYVIINFLKEEMSKVSSIFSQIGVIMSFVEKCSDIVRVFKKEYDKDKIDEIIDGNIELKREGAYPYVAPSKHKVYEDDVFTYSFEREEGENGGAENYDGQHPNDEDQFYTSHNIANIDEIFIPYTGFDSSGTGEDAKRKFLDTYEGLRINNELSTIYMGYEIEGQEYQPLVTVNTSPYSSEALKFTNDGLITADFKNIGTNELQEDGSKEVIAAIDPNTYSVYQPKEFTNGGRMNVNVDNDGLRVTGSSYSKFRFNEEGVDLTDTIVTDKEFVKSTANIRPFDISKTYWNSVPEVKRYGTAYQQTPPYGQEYTNSYCSYNIHQMIYENYPNRNEFLGGNVENWKHSPEDLIKLWGAGDHETGTNPIIPSFGRGNSLWQTILERKDRSAEGIWHPGYDSFKTDESEYLVEDESGSSLKDIPITQILNDSSTAFRNSMKLSVSSQAQFTFGHDSDPSGQADYPLNDDSGGSRAGLNDGTGMLPHDANMSYDKNTIEGGNDGQEIVLIAERLGSGGKHNDDEPEKKQVSAIYFYKYFLVFHKNKENILLSTFDIKRTVGLEGGGLSTSNEIAQLRGVELKGLNENITLTYNIAGGTSNGANYNAINSLIFVAKDSGAPRKQYVLKNKKRV